MPVETNQLRRRRTIFDAIYSKRLTDAQLDALADLVDVVGIYVADDDPAEAQVETQAARWRVIRERYQTFTDLIKAAS